MAPAPSSSRSHGDRSIVGRVLALAIVALLVLPGTLGSAPTNTGTTTISSGGISGDDASFNTTTSNYYAKAPRGDFPVIVANTSVTVNGYTKTGDPKGAFTATVYQNAASRFASASDGTNLYTGTNDTTALRTAVDYIRSSGGGSLYVQNGTWNLSFSQIDTADSYFSQLYPRGFKNAFLIDVDFEVYSNAGATLRPANGEAAGFDNVTNSTGGLVAFYVNAPGKHVSIHNMNWNGNDDHVTSNYESLVFYKGAQSMSITDNIITTARSSIWGDNGTNDLIISGNRLDLRQNENGIAIHNTPEHCVINGNDITSPSLGIFLDSTWGCSVVGNTITNAANWGIQLFDGANDNVITGNVIMHRDGARSVYGIDVYTDLVTYPSKSTNDRNLILGNIVRDATTGIRVQGANNIVFNNYQTNTPTPFDDTGSGTLGGWIDTALNLPPISVRGDIQRTVDTNSINIYGGKNSRGADLRLYGSDAANNGGDIFLNAASTNGAGTGTPVSGNVVIQTPTSTPGALATRLNITSSNGVQPSATWTNTTVVFGTSSALNMNGNSLINAGVLDLTPTALTTCDSTQRGNMRWTQPGSEQRDVLWICGQDKNNNYAWQRESSTGFTANMTGGATSVAITFGQNEADTNYAVTCTPTWDAGGLWITSKAIGGFTINAHTAPGSTSEVGCALSRAQG